MREGWSLCPSRGGLPMCPTLASSRSAQQDHHHKKDLGPARMRTLPTGGKPPPRSSPSSSSPLTMAGSARRPEGRGEPFGLPPPLPRRAPAKCEEAPRCISPAEGRARLGSLTAEPAGPWPAPPADAEKLLPSARSFSLRALALARSALLVGVYFEWVGGWGRGWVMLCDPGQALQPAACSHPSPSQVAPLPLPTSSTHLMRSGLPRSRVSSLARLDTLMPWSCRGEEGGGGKTGVKTEEW